MEATTSIQALKIKWLESTLEFTGEKIKAEDVLAQILTHLAIHTALIKSEEQKITRMIAKSEALLADMQAEAEASKEAKNVVARMMGIGEKEDESNTTAFQEFKLHHRRSMLDGALRRCEKPV